MKSCECNKEVLAKLNSMIREVSLSLLNLSPSPHDYCAYLTKVASSLLAMALIPTAKSEEAEKEFWEMFKSVTMEETNDLREQFEVELKKMKKNRESK